MTSTSRPGVALPQFVPADPWSNVSLGADTGDRDIVLWSSPETRTEAGRETQTITFELSSSHPVVIGRPENVIPPHLDSAFRLTRMAPNTGQLAVHSDGCRDTSVSSAPFNGTWLVEPCVRLLQLAEYDLSERGAVIRICLPNGNRLLIRAA